MNDHAPIGSVALRCEPADLRASAQALYLEALEAPEDIAARLTLTAMWYDDLAADLVAIRSLPEVYPPLSRHEIGF